MGKAADKASPVRLDSTATQARERRFYASILEHSPDLTYVFDREHRFIYANRVLLEMWGKTWDEAIGRTCLELGYEPWHAAMHDREIEQVIATRAPIRGEVPFTGTFGRRHYDYIFVPVFGADGEVEAVAGTTRDVPERRQHEDAARFQQATWETLLARAPIGIILVDADFRVRAVNPAAEPIFANVPGGGLDEDFAKVLQIVWPPHYAAEVEMRFRHTLETGEPFAIPERGEVRADLGQTEYYDWRLDQLTMPDGRAGVVCYFRDISSEVQARHAIEQNRDALRAADRRKDEFLATLAHELRNPLAPLKSCLNILRQDTAGQIAPAQLHAVMERQLDQMVRLVDDLLEVSRITRGKIDLRLEAVDVSEVTGRAVETSEPLFKATGHTLDLDVPANCLPLVADPLRLAQAVSNLLNNAAKYTEPGGQVSLRAWRDGNEAVIAVRDNGVGLATDQLNHVFDLFVQAEGARARAQGGLGIGLTLVRQLVELHGGSVSADSAGLGTGSEFRMRLPLA